MMHELVGVYKSSDERGGSSARVDGRTRPQTKERLLNAAMRAFADKGFYATAVDDIVQGSSTSKGSFYNFFPSKQHIFLALIDRLSRRMIRQIQRAVGQRRGALNKVDAALHEVLDHFYRHERLARILLIEASGLGHGFNEKQFELHIAFADLIKTYLDEAVAEQSIEPIDTELTAFAWLGAIHEIVLRWLHTGEGRHLHEVLPGLRRHLLASIGVSINEMTPDSPDTAEREAKAETRENQNSALSPHAGHRIDDGALRRELELE